MFEHQADAVQELLASNADFKSLYEQHQEMKEKIRKAETGVIPMEPYALERAKKEKLHLKDQMAAILNQNAGS